VTTPETLSGIDYQRINDMIKSEFSRNQLLQYLSRHPTGTPLFLEDWSYGRAYSIDTAGAGYLEVVYKSDEVGAVEQPNVFNGKAMGKLATPGTGAIDATEIFYNMMPLSNMRLGMEVNFALPHNSLTDIRAAYSYINLGAIRLQKRVGGLTVMYNPTLYYWPNTDSIQLSGVPGDPFILTNVFGQLYSTRWFLVWHNLKFIVDFENLKTVKLYFNDLEIDLSAYTIEQKARIHPLPMLQFLLGPADKGSQAVMFVGNLMLTMEEP